ATTRGAFWRRGVLVAVLGAAMLLIGCAASPPPRRVAYGARGSRAADTHVVDARRAAPTSATGSDASAARTPATYDTRPPIRITAVTTRIPGSWETPPIVGRFQHHRVAQGENLLEIARASGLGFREVRDANP